MFGSPLSEHLTKTASILSLPPSLHKQRGAGNETSLLTSLGHSIQDSNSQRGHAQLSRKLPNAHQGRIIGYHLSATLIIDVACVKEVLKTAEGIDVCIRKPDDMFDFLNLTLGELLTIVWGLRTKKVFLDTEWNLFLANEEDNKDRVRITVQLIHTLTEMLRNLLPGDACRSLTYLSGKINALV